MTHRQLRENIGAWIAGLQVRIGSCRLQLSATEIAVFVLFLIILGLAGAADVGHP